VSTELVAIQGFRRSVLQASGLASWWGPAAWWTPPWSLANRGWAHDRIARSARAGASAFTAGYLLLRSSWTLSIRGWLFWNTYLVTGRKTWLILL